ncbi:zf-HC2 domain-containing protein [Dysosmobacter sp.]|uniref:zf-HC2 domain-containing protein n=1 Tax=Dysosmobacter sp. TaxID=2591382 RepID=UPI003FD8D734
MNCGIIQDLLPLYHDGVCSPESRTEVEEHLKTCPDCRAALAAMDAPLPEVEKAAADDAAAMKKISGAWKKDKRRAWILGGIAAFIICAVMIGGLWYLTTFTVVPMGSEDYTVEVYQLESGGVGVHWEFREGKKTWYALVFREEEDGLHYYLERPILRIKLFDFDHKHYNQSGDALFNNWLEDDTSEDAIYFGLGEDAVLLWKEGEEVNLPAATDAQEEMWAIAELPPQEVP